MSNFKSFFDHAMAHLETEGIDIKITKGRTIRCDDGICSGYFDGITFAAAGGSRLFEHVFAHEYAHFLQSLDPKCSAWHDCDDIDIWSYLKNKKTLNINSWDQIIKTIAVERDCEARTLKLSTKWGLFDNAEYAKRANVYLHFYQWVFLNHKWISTKKLYDAVELMDSMPETLLPQKYFNKIDMDVMQQFESLLNPKRGKRKP